MCSRLLGVLFLFGFAICYVSAGQYSYSKVPYGKVSWTHGHGDYDDHDHHSPSHHSPSHGSYHGHHGSPVYVSSSHGHGHGHGHSHGHGHGHGHSIGHVSSHGHGPSHGSHYTGHHVSHGPKVIIREHIHQHNIHKHNHHVHTHHRHNVHQHQLNKHNVHLTKVHEKIIHNHDHKQVKVIPHKTVEYRVIPSHESVVKHHEHVQHAAPVVIDHGWSKPEGHGPVAYAPHYPHSLAAPSGHIVSAAQVLTSGPATDGWENGQGWTQWTPIV